MLIGYLESLWLNYPILLCTCFVVGTVVFYITKRNQLQIQSAKKKNNSLKQIIEANNGTTTVKSLPKRIKSRSIKKASNQTCNNDLDEKSASCCGNGDDCCKNQLSETTTTTTNESSKISIKIFYATQTSTAKYFAQQLYESFIKHPLNCECTVMDIVDYETE